MFISNPLVPVQTTQLTNIASAEYFSTNNVLVALYSSHRALYYSALCETYQLHVFPSEDVNDNVSL